MSDICYKKNFLKQVIAKIEFANPLTNISNDTFLEALQEIKHRFPISEQGVGVFQNIQVGEDGGAKTSKNEFSEWIFHGEDRDKYLRFNQHFFEVVLSKYHSEKDFISDIIQPVCALMGRNSSSLVLRTSVRFVNIFDIDFPNIDIIKDLFDPMITTHFPSSESLKTCTRSFLVNEYLEDEIKYRVQTGLFNPDYPAIIKRRHFVIDIDAYVDFPHKISDVENYLKDSHSGVQKMFESLITDKLRGDYLNV